MRTEPAAYSFVRSRTKLAMALPALCLLALPACGGGDEASGNSPSGSGSSSGNTVSSNTSGGVTGTNAATQTGSSLSATGS
ncbi:MAG TPA: hypothetical protein VI197_20685, partial [Polyangiaceae bacterium]